MSKTKVAFEFEFDSRVLSIGIRWEDDRTYANLLAFTRKQSLGEEKGTTDVQVHSPISGNFPNSRTQYVEKGQA